MSTNYDPEEIKQELGNPNLDPYEIQFLPQFRQGRGQHEAFINEHGVVIGDHEYDSPNNPLNNWSEDVDPSVMAGDEWVHPYKDVGFQTAENRDYFEQGIVPQSGVFMHPDKDVAYEADVTPAGAAETEDKRTE